MHIVVHKNENCRFIFCLLDGFVIDFRKPKSVFWKDEDIYRIRFPMIYK